MIKDYLASINKMNFDQLLLDLKEYAKENDVPIIQDEGLLFLRQIIKVAKPERILEIGTAIGYSAINMAKLGAFVDTIEINEDSFNIALENVKKAGLEEKITIHYADALELDISKLNSHYDLIFIDAAKAQYKKFFEKYSVLLSTGGIIVTDNLCFHGLVLEENIESKNLRKLVEKIKGYNTWLLDNLNYDSVIYDIGDGMGISIKR